MGAPYVTDKAGDHVPSAKESGSHCICGDREAKACPAVKRGVLENLLSLLSIHVSVYLRIYLSIHLSTVSIYLCIYLSVCTCICIHIYIYIQCVCRCACLYVHMQLRTCGCMCVCIYQVFLKNRHQAQGVVVQGNLRTQQGGGRLHASGLRTSEAASARSPVQPQASNVMSVLFEMYILWSKVL